MSEANALLGAELRAMRESLGMSGVAAAAGVGWSQSKLSRVETGRFGASLVEVAELLDYYGAPEEVRAELLARVARRDGLDGAWVVRAGGSGRRTASLGHVESRVTHMCQYAATVVPGLLQAPAYTAALLDAGGWDAPEQIIATRRARQERLYASQGMRYEVVLDARALERWPGPVEVMASQLEHLVEVPEPVSLRVLPTGPHARHAAVSPFLMYEFGPAAPVVVLCETHTADLYLSADADIASYRALYDGLQDAALSPQDSRAYLADAARDLRAAD